MMRCRTESPIEADLLGAFISASDAVEVVPNVTFSALLLMAQTQPAKVFIGTQVHICRYRADFILTSQKTAVYERGLCVECDGAAWHSTNRQVASDWQRDERFRQLNIDVLRFSGKQIRRDPHKCAYEALERVSGHQFRGQGETQLGAFASRSIKALAISARQTRTMEAAG